MTYANLENLLADYLPDVEKDEDLAAIGRILENVSAFVDTFCDRTSGFFNPSPDVATVKRVRGEGHRFLRLPVHVFGSLQEIDGKPFAEYSAYLYESDKNGWLYFESEEFGNENSFSSICGDLPFNNRNFIDGRVFKIKARWGYAATPKDLEEAVRQTVCRLWEVKKGTLGQQTPNGFIIERALPLFAKEVFTKYRKRPFEI